MELYIARRYLGLSPAEWDNLPWWVRRTYIEGFEAEELVSGGEPSDASGSNPPPDLASASIGAAAALGFTEEVVGPDGVVRRVGPSGV